MQLFLFFCSPSLILFSLFLLLFFLSLSAQCLCCFLFFSSLFLFLLCSSLLSLFPLSSFFASAPTFQFSLHSFSLKSSCSKTVSSFPLFPFFLFPFSSLSSVFHYALPLLPIASSGLFSDVLSLFFELLSLFLCFLALFFTRHQWISVIHLACEVEGNESERPN